ncbi:MAG: chorismate lyase [Thiotrichales bacterium]|nr:chorismate lyase [Thiotrichales bacterium]
MIISLQPHPLTSWYPATLLSRLGADARTRSWLQTPSSLTQRIRQYCPQMRVKVLFQGLSQPNSDERLWLKLPAGQRVWMREVLLQCDQQNWVYARTVIANFTPGNPWLSLQTLGTQPLGEILFEQRNIQRSALVFQRYAYQLPIESSSALARRSCFIQRGQAHYPLLLTEVFLEPLPITLSQGASRAPN